MLMPQSPPLKIKNKGAQALQPSGASDPCGRGGLRPQLPVAAKARNAKNLRPAMRPRSPGYGVRVLARWAGVEPATRGFGDRRSAVELPPHKKEHRPLPMLLTVSFYHIFLALRCNFQISPKFFATSRIKSPCHCFAVRSDTPSFNAAPNTV